MSDVDHRIDELEQQLEKMWIYMEKVEDRAVGFHSNLMTIACMVACVLVFFAVVVVRDPLAAQSFTVNLGVLT